MLSNIVFNLAASLKVPKNHILVFSSFRMGDYVTLGGRVVVRDHVSIVSKVFT